MRKQFETPILFLLFNRPAVAQQVFNQIKAIKPRHLYIAADGPRTDRKDDIINCKQTREIINQVDWECDIKTLFRGENLGCGFGVCSAISWFFEQVEEGIILEDDCFPDISFFYFCDEVLRKYKEDKSIYVISGTNLQNGIKRGNASYYFSNYPITWGWASWRRAWRQFSYNIPDFDKSFKSGALSHVFQSAQEKNYWRNKIRKGELEKKYIWDYQWYFAVWKNKGISIVPNVNLITNIGFRNNATHTFLCDSIREPLTKNSIQFPLIAPPKTIDRKADYFAYQNAFSHSISRFYRLIKENGIFSVFKYTLSRLVNSIKSE